MVRPAEPSSDAVASIPTANGVKPSASRYAGSRMATKLSPKSRSARAANKRFAVCCPRGPGASTPPGSQAQDRRRGDEGAQIRAFVPRVAPFPSQFRNEVGAAVPMREDDRLARSDAQVHAGAQAERGEVLAGDVGFERTVERRDVQVQMRHAACEIDVPQARVPRRPSFIVFNAQVLGPDVC